MKKAQKIAVVLTGCLVFAVLTACSKPTETAQVPAAPVESVNENVIDLGGMEIVIGNWWANWDAYEVEPANTVEERTVEWRKEIQEKYNFKMREANVGSWEQIAEVASTSIISGTPAANIFVLQPNWAMPLYSQKLLAPVSDQKLVDLNSTNPVEWNKAIGDAFTFGGKTYAFVEGYGGAQHGSGIYFNKRILEEAGINPESLYDMQKNGPSAWNWDTFLEMCKKVTRDIDNDGVIDVYAITALNTDTLDTIVASNNANYVVKDPASGKLVSGITTPEFLQAYQFSCRLWTEGVIMPQAEGAQWNYFEAAFHDGKGAFRIAAQYVGGQLTEMADDWGFVLFPSGPNNKTNGLLYPTDEIPRVIPATYTPEEVEKIMFAYSLWVTPAPGNEDPDNWKAAFYNIFRDSRAVDESLAALRIPEYALFNNWLLVPGLNRGDIGWHMWYDGVDPATQIESVSAAWDATIAEANAVN